MLKYSQKEDEEETKKEQLREKLPKLEVLVEQLMFQRMRWDLHFMNMTTKQNTVNIEEEKKGQEP